MPPKMIPLHEWRPKRAAGGAEAEHWHPIAIPVARIKKLETGVVALWPDHNVVHLPATKVDLTGDEYVNVKETREEILEMING